MITLWQQGQLGTHPLAGRAVVIGTRAFLVITSEVAHTITPGNTLPGLKPVF
jgi:hypothetical protein